MLGIVGLNHILAERQGVRVAANVGAPRKCCSEDPQEDERGQGEHHQVGVLEAAAAGRAAACWVGGGDACG